MVKLYPESSAVFDNIVKYSVKLSVASAELEYIHSELSFFNIVNNEVENPLKRVEDSRLDLTRTDDDILKSIKAAKEREKTTKKEKGGDVIDLHKYWSHKNGRKIDFKQAVVELYSELQTGGR